jgi:type VI secretion system FHA domain protein
MAIEITIINAPSNTSVAQKSQTFADTGGTLGRGGNNFWVLEDPNKFMSSVHAEIVIIEQQYFLKDLSTNGTFINGASEPLGSGNQIALNDGDRFIISDYEFINKVIGSVDTKNISQSNTDPFADFDNASHDALQNDAFFQASTSDPFALASHGNQATTDALSAFNDVQTDPLALLDNAKPNLDPFAKSSTSLSDFSSANTTQNNEVLDDFTATTSTTIDNNDVATDSINWPNISQESGQIPDNWDEDDLMADLIEPIATVKSPSQLPEVEKNPVYLANVQKSTQQVPHNVEEQLGEQHPVSQVSKDKFKALELHNQQLQSEVAQLKAQLLKVQSLQTSPNSQNVNEPRSVVNAMGLSKWNLEDSKVLQINETVGCLMRETMQGMMQVLKFRKKIKEEFRINVTTIQSIENNPLKFSANIDDAMENMFIKENNAYKSPIDSVKEGFQGIAEHQVAVIAGMQAAFRGMIDRFEPNSLESRFEKYKSSSLLNLGQKAKRWNDYKQYHQGLVENLDDSFQHLFGYDFVQAYEQQMQSLISARLNPAKENDNNN